MKSIRVSKITFFYFFFFFVFQLHTTNTFAKNIDHTANIVSVKDTIDDRSQLLRKVQEARTSTNIDSAQLFVEDALDMFVSADDETGQATALQVLGYIKTNQKFYSSAAEHFHKATKLFERYDDVQNVSRTLYYKSLLSLKQNDLKDALNSSRRGYDTCKKIDCMEEGEFLELLFLVSNQMHKLPDAKKYAYNAIKYYDKHTDTENAADIYLQLANAYQENDLYQEAYEAYQEALARYELRNANRKACQINYRLGEHYFAQERYEEAMTKLAETESCAKELKTKSLEADALNKTGETYFALEDYKNAIKSLKRSSRIRKSRGDKKGNVENLILLGKVYQANDAPKRAIKSFENSAEISQAIGDNNGLLQAYSGIARVHMEDDKLDEASEYADQALEVLEEITNLSAIKETYVLVSELFEKRGELNQAENFAKKAKYLQDSLKGIAKDKELKLELLKEELAAVNIKIDDYKKESIAQIKKMEEQKTELASNKVLIEEQERAAKEKSKYLTTLSLVSLVSVLFLGFALYKGRAQKQANIQLQTVNKELEFANKELAESEARLQHFAYSVAHDFKNPINSILGFSTLLGESLEGRLSKDEEEYLEYIGGSSIAISQMVSDLREYATIGSDLSKVEQVDLGNIVLEIKRDLSSLIREKAARFEIQPLPNIEAHPSMIRQLFQNLIGNSIKYSETDVQPMIKISNEVIAGETIFQVSDNGIGIPESEQDKIFDLFNRAGQQDNEGSGIGLALCKRIVEIYGGKIWLKSPVGEGSTFFFTLPNALK